MPVFGILIRGPFMLRAEGAFVCNDAGAAAPVLRSGSGDRVLTDLSWTKGI